MNSHGLHQPRHGAAGDIEALAAHLPPDLAHAVNLPVGVENALDLGPKRLIPPGTVRQSRRISTLGQVVIMAGRGDRQNLADRLDPMCAR